jgi:hypothetical protein
MTEPIPYNDPRALDSDDIVVVVNLRTGRIAEIPCGPKDAQYVSGDRLVVWSPHEGKVVIPKRHAATWRFYEGFCSDAEIAKRHGLTVVESRQFFEAYRSLMKKRGVGAHAKHLHDVTPERVEKELWHPEVSRLRQLNRHARGHARVDEGAFDLIVASLPRRDSPAESPIDAKVRAEREATDAKLEADRSPKAKK